MPTLNDPAGQPAKVDSGGRVHAYSILESEAMNVNKENEEAYTVMVDVTTLAVTSDFFYLQNTDSRTLAVTRVEGWCDDANQEISIYLAATDAGTAAGDTLTPSNLNAGSGNSADVVCTQDATDLAITGGRVVNLLKFPTTALERAIFDFSETGLVVPKNQRIHMKAALAGLINLNITFFYYD